MAKRSSLPIPCWHPPNLYTTSAAATPCPFFSQSAQPSLIVPRWETTTLMVSYNTPLEVLEELRVRLNAYVAANNREWSNCALNIDKMEYQNAIHLIVAMERK